MNAVWSSATALLLVTGTLLGLSLPFGKIATAAGAPALLWALVISFGAGGALLLALLATNGPPRLTAAKLRYFVLAAAISYAVPNILSFTTIPHLGVGYVGLMFTLSPVFTLAMSILFGLRRPTALGVAGIGVGFAGALIVALTRGAAGQPAEIAWVLAGLLIPVFLAAGNIYRTIDWPADAGPIELAVGSHLAAAAMLFAALAATGQAGSIALLADMPWLVTAQMLAAASMFAFFFRLQSVGGPVFLSQIGYVAAAVGLVSGTLFLGERYGLPTWIGAAIITLGIVMTTRAQNPGSR